MQQMAQFAQKTCYFKVLSKTNLDTVRLEYGEIVNSYEISNHDEIDDVWDQSDDGIGPKKNSENLTKLCSLTKREGSWYQGSHQMNGKITFHTTNEN